MTVWALILCTLLLPPMLRAADEPVASPPDVNLILVLRDGTRIVGQPDHQMFIFKSPMVDRLEIPAARLRSITWGTGPASAVFKTVHGDQMEATLVVEHLAIASAFGRLTVPVARLSEVQMVPRIPGETIGGMQVASGGPNASPPEVNLVLILRDGSRIMGQPEKQHFIFKSPLADRLEIPAARLRTITWGTNQTKALFKAVNGDQMEVTLAAEHLVITTLVGKLSVPVPRLNEIQVVPQKPGETSGAMAFDTNAGVTATLELRDGSRFIGQPETNVLLARSPEIGEFQVPLAFVRKLSFTQTNATLRTVADDQIKVALGVQALRLRTGYGEVNVPVSALLDMECRGRLGKLQLTRDLVCRWSAENDAKDSVGKEHGETLFGAEFAPGKVGKAFVFSGQRSRVFIPDSERLALKSAFSVEGWVYVQEYPPDKGAGILCQRGDNRPGLDTWSLSTTAAGKVSFSINSEGNESLPIEAAIPRQHWFHVAAVFDEDEGALQLFINGRKEAQGTVNYRPIWVLDGSPDAGIGLGNHSGRLHEFPFHGRLDEWGLYSRALSPAEIQAIMDAAQAGEKVAK